MAQIMFVSVFGDNRLSLERFYHFPLLCMCRIESIGLLETQGGFGSLQRKQITLVDTDGARLKFLLWGEQVLLANLFR